MAIMHAPREPRIRTIDPPVDPRAVDDLLRYRERYDENDAHRDEILDGELVVSPLPVHWHDRACRWLERSLADLCDRNGWYASAASEIELPPNRDHIQPDLTVFRDADSLPDMENVMPLDHVLLVAEVVSPSTTRRDREVKPRVCARAGVPLYLLVDRFTEPFSVTVLSKPRADGYAKTDAMIVGEKLHIPGPFDFTLDTSTFPLPR
jgi:Uma2 family endonuclease